VQITHNQSGKLPLEEIEAFVAVAGAGSFSSAAERMNISHSSLSRKVAHLEDRVGQKLLVRKANGVSMTEVGADRFLRFRDALNLIGHSLGWLDTNQNTPTVRISMLDSFAIFWLFPRHEKLSRELENINLQYNVDAKLASFADGIDLAIRFGAGNWPGTKSIRLNDLDYRPMAHVSIAEKLGPDATPQDLLKFPLIHLKTEVSWVVWLEANGASYRIRPQDRTFSELPTALAAVQNGMGIGLSRAPFRHLLDSGGVLRHVSSKSFPGRSSYYLVRDGSKPLRLPVRRFAEALLKEAEVSDSAAAEFLAD
jgi:LysR family transcriptional regulator, glycine cleavage system transcriptional activator